MMISIVLVVILIIIRSSSTLKVHNFEIFLLIVIELAMVY